MQEHMPHIIITCKSKTMLAQMHALHVAPRPNVHIWKEEQSSWNNSKLMHPILVLNRKAVEGKPDVPPVVLL